MNAEFWHKYRKQNPVKYKMKFGDKEPEELADPSPEMNIGITIKPLKELETSFSTTPPEAVWAPEPDASPEKVVLKAAKKSIKKK